MDYREVIPIILLYIHIIILLKHESLGDYMNNVSKTFILST